jgi:hypothetical protein
MTTIPGRRMTKEVSMPPRKRKKPNKNKRVRLNYGNFDLDIPVNDVFENLNLDEPGDLEEALDNFIFELKNGYFFMWEAVVCEEKGIKLSRKQKKLLDELLYFSDNDNDQILYIDEIPRPKEAWYEIARKIVPRLLVEPFKTDAVMYSVMHEGWANLVEALEEHAQDLSLPEGIESTLDIFPHDLQHRLWLQTCFDALSGLGQGEDLTLENEDQQHRVEWFIDLLREHKDTVQYFDLTLETMLTRVIISTKDEKLFITMIMEQLGLPTSQACIAEYL